MIPISSQAGTPDAPQIKRFRSQVGEHLLVVPHTRVFDLPADFAARLDSNPIEVARLAEILAETAVRLTSTPS